jgi:hypothetical protein
MTKILIKMESGHVRIILKRRGETVGEESFLDEHNLTEKLLVITDKLLKKNSLAAGNISKIEVESDSENNYTSNRIAKTIARSWNWARSTEYQ